MRLALAPAFAARPAGLHPARLCPASKRNENSSGHKTLPLSFAQVTHQSISIGKRSNCAGPFASDLVVFTQYGPWGSERNVITTNSD